VLSPVGTGVALRNAATDDSFHLQLLSTSARSGTGVDAPMYGTVREVTVNGVLTAYDLSYYFFYPFDGNIFDKKTLETILAAGVVFVATAGLFVGALTLALLPLAIPALGQLTASGVIGLLSSLIDFFRTGEGLMLHEGDWEHVTVRINLDQRIIGVYYAAHAGEGGWYENVVHENSRDGYQLMDGTHPLVFSARHSHASYPYHGTRKRYSGFANDEMDCGQLWRGRVIDIGHDKDNPVEGQEWLSFQGRWGRKETKPFAGVTFGKDGKLQEFVNGPRGPAWGGTWDNGDPMAPTTWSHDDAFTTRAGRFIPTSIAAATVKGTVTLVQRVQDGTALTAGFTYRFFFGLEDLPLGVRSVDDALPFLDPSTKYELAMAGLGDELHLFYAGGAGQRLGWATLNVDDLESKKIEWKPRQFPFQDEGGDLTGPSATVFGDDLYLLSTTDKVARPFPLKFYRYDGNSWSDLSDTVPPDFEGLDGATKTSLTTYNNNIYCTFPAFGPANVPDAEAIQLASYDPVTRQWAKRYQWAYHPPQTQYLNAVVAGFDDYLYVVYLTNTGMTPGLQRYWTRYNEATGWRPFEEITPFRLLLGPLALTAVTDETPRLLLFYSSWLLVDAVTRAVEMPR
jgi:hypothetical protein